jgi:hypothetical protein
MMRTFSYTETSCPKNVERSGCIKIGLNRDNGRRGSIRDDDNLRCLCAARNVRAFRQVGICDYNISELNFGISTRLTPLEFVKEIGIVPTLKIGEPFPLSTLERLKIPAAQGR